MGVELIQSMYLIAKFIKLVDLIMKCLIKIWFLSYKWDIDLYCESAKKTPIGFPFTNRESIGIIQSFD